jgi:zinc protease
MKIRLLIAGLLAVSGAWAETQVVALPGKSPLVDFRFVFRTGAAYDPPGKPGTAALAAAMLSKGGSRELTYKQIIDAMFPMASSVDGQVDKEMVTFSAETHVDNLEAFYKLFRAMLLQPGWRQEDLDRLRDDAINFLRVSLRGNNDEELGKELLYLQIYQGHPYGHHNVGTVSSLQKLTLEDLQQFYKTQFTADNLIIGIAGDYPAGFIDRVKKDFAALPKTNRPKLTLPKPKPIEHNRVLMVDKDTRSVAYSFGFPIEVTRGHPDFAALLVAQSYFGQHRNSGGRLFGRMRQQRGLNYGDYAYIEYFPRGMFLFEPDPNLARRQQIFQVWIRPVEPPTSMFALRLAIFELNKLVNEGVPADAFERTRNYLGKNVNLLTKTKQAELGYMIDSLYYNIQDYGMYLKNQLSKLTLEDVNKAVRKHLRADRLQIVVVADDVDAISKLLLSGAPSPMEYNSPKPEEIMEEDKKVERYPIAMKPEWIKVVPVSSVFE